MSFEIDKFHRRERLFKSELGISPYWIDVIPKEVTLKKTFDPTIFENQTRGAEMSPFEEVSTVPFFDACSEDDHKFMRTNYERYRISEEELAFKLYDVLYECIEANWESEKFHLLTISSGYDMRTFAMIISQLREKHGKDWIGELLFYEIGEEGEGACKIWEYLKLTDYPFIHLNGEKAPDEIYEDNLDFSRAWERHGIVGWPVNYWYDGPDILQKEGLIPSTDKLQGLTGYACNETSRCSQISEKFINKIAHLMSGYPVGNDLAYYFHWVYYCTINSFPLLGKWMHPWYNYKVMETLYINSLGQKNLKEIVKKGGSVSDIIIKHVNPELHNVVEPLRLKKMEELGYRKVSDRLMKKAVSDYKSSWYGKIIKPDVIPTPLVTYNDWWGHWNMASLCQHLIEEGYLIKY